MVLTLSFPQPSLVSLVVWKPSQYAFVMSMVIWVCSPKVSHRRIHLGSVDRPMPLAHLEMGSPVTPIYSAMEPAPCRGSELLLAGMPKPVPFASAWRALFQSTAASVLSRPMMSTWRTLSSVMNFFCWSVRSQGLAPLSS